MKTKLQSNFLGSQESLRNDGFLCHSYTDGSSDIKFSGRGFEILGACRRCLIVVVVASS